MMQERKKPPKPREVGVRPERLAKIRNPEIFRRKEPVDDFQDLLKSKAERAQKEFQLNTNAVTVLNNLSKRAQAIGQEAVNQANSAEEISEKLVLVNKGLIEVIKLCERTAEFTSGAVHKFQAEINLLSELSKDLQPSESVAEESVEEIDNEEKSEIEEAVEPTE